MEINENKMTVGKTSVEFYPTHPIQPVSINQSTKLQPYKCPVCNGSMLVAGGFYVSTGGFGTSSSSQEKCRSCVNGIIWG